MNKPGYIFISCMALLCLHHPAPARSWTYGQVLRRNLWNLSDNVSGIRQDSLSQSYAEVYGKWSSGGFRDSWQATDTWSAGAVTESIRHLDKFSLKGSFSFDQTEGYGMCGSMLMYPGHYPVDVMEFTPGRKTRQTYSLRGGISADIAPFWRIGADMDFMSSNLAKRKDLRHTNWRLDMTVSPGFMYHGEAFSAGAAYIFSKNSETVNAEQVGTAGASYSAFLDKGMMYGTYAAWNGSGIHLSESGVSGLPFMEIKNGVSVQFSVAGLFLDARYVRSSGRAGEKEYVWFRFPGDEAGLCAGFRLSRSGREHYWRIMAVWERQVNDESVLEKVSGNGVVSVISHGSRRIASRETWSLSPEYEYVSGLWELHASAGISIKNSQASQMYPYLYSQSLAKFSADVNGLVHVWKFDLCAALGYATGLLSEDSLMSAGDSGVQTSPFRLQDWHDLQMEYETAARIYASLSCRMWLWRGLYCMASAEWTHGFMLKLLSGPDRFGASLRLGYEF